MNARNATSTAIAQPRSGMQSVIPHWAYRHLRLGGVTQLDGGSSRRP
jgi:hypothetical protein